MIKTVLILLNIVKREINLLIKLFKMANTEKFRDACEEAVKCFDKLKNESQTEIKSKLEYCIGSYDHDKNPSGLYEYGKIALEELKSFKAKNPRKVNKKIIDNLEKNLEN